MRLQILREVVGVGAVHLRRRVVPGGDRVLRRPGGVCGREVALGVACENTVRAP